MVERALYSIEQLPTLAAKVAANLQGGEVVALQGDLGAGKTTFVQALARELGVERPVLSPTFALERQYDTNRGFKLHHFDWYRLDNQAEVYELGIEELFGDPASVTVIEWPERAAGLLPEQTFWIRFEYVDSRTRKITVST